MKKKYLQLYIYISISSLFGNKILILLSRTVSNHKNHVTLKLQRVL